MKFSPAIEQKLSDDLSLVVPGAWLNPKGLAIAEVQLYNGTLLHSDTVCLGNNTARLKFIKAVTKRAKVEADEVENALLLIGGNLTTTLADELEEDAEESAKPNQATALLELASDAEFFHDSNDEGYATFEVNGHKETWRIKVSGFRNWLLRRYYKETGGTANSQALQDALNVLQAKALFDGPELPVFVRVAEHQGNIYVDLCNEKWEVVEITSSGWRVLSESPVKFKHASGMLALPYPVAGGSTDELRPFINLNSESDWVLFCSWLAQAIRPAGPYPVLVFHGEQGSSKSTVQSMARSLIDPNSAPLRTEPRGEHDLVISASNSWCVCLDNLSHISLTLSDAICRLSTGGGFATRQLYTDGDEVLFNAQRPVLINGIEEVVTRGDLLDRALINYLPSIPSSKRRPQAELWADFNAAKPRILGALYDAVSVAMRNIAAIKLTHLPRMADFAMWATAAETGFGFKPGAFLSAYMTNRDSSNDLVLESSSVATVLVAFVEKEDSWLGTATDLLKELNSQANESTQRLKTWPKDGRTLSNRLRRLAPNLRAAGVAIEFDITEGHKKKRLIRLEWACNSASAASASVETEQNQDLDADAQNNSGRKGDESADANAEPSNYVKSKQTKGDDMDADAADVADAKKQSHSEARMNDFSCCPTCGYEGQRFTDCPECGDEIR